MSGIYTFHGSYLDPFDIIGQIARQIRVPYLTCINSMCSIYYRIFKTEFVFEKYLNCCSLYSTRLSKLCCQSHNLSVNQDRFNKQRDISKSLCVLCSQNDIGD